MVVEYNLQSAPLRFSSGAGSWYTGWWDDIWSCWRYEHTCVAVNTPHCNSVTDTADVDGGYRS